MHSKGIFYRCFVVQWDSLTLFPYVTCCPTSLQHLVNLFARLANDNIGYINWDDYIPKVCFHLFVNYPFPPATISVTCLF